MDRAACPEIAEIAVHDIFRDYLGWLGCLAVYDDHRLEVHSAYWLTHRAVDIIYRRCSTANLVGVTSANMSRAHIFRDRTLAERCTVLVEALQPAYLSIGLSRASSVVPAYSFIGESATRTPYNDWHDTGVPAYRLATDSSTVRVLSPYADCRAIDLTVLMQEWRLDSDA